MTKKKKLSKAELALKEAEKANASKIDFSGFGNFLNKENVRKRRVVHAMANSMFKTISDEERRRRNGDHNRKDGFSSTGVKLPTKKELEEYHCKRQDERERHAHFVRENPDRKKHGKMIIYIASGGQNKKW